MSARSSQGAPERGRIRRPGICRRAGGAAPPADCRGRPGSERLSEKRARRVRRAYHSHSASSASHEDLRWRPGRALLLALGQRLGHEPWLRLVRHAACFTPKSTPTGGCPFGGVAVLPMCTPKLTYHRPELSVRIDAFLIRPPSGRVNRNLTSPSLGMRTQAHLRFSLVTRTACPGSGIARRGVAFLNRGNPAGCSAFQKLS